MLSYNYFIPKTYEEALEILFDSPKQIKILGGGTDLLIRIRNRKEKPVDLVDISSVDLSYIKSANMNKTIIGSMTNLNAILNYPSFPEPLKVLKDAAKEIGGVQTRSLATIGGNVCTGVPTADMAITLLALEADLFLESKKGARIIPIEEFFISPKVTALNKDEILKEIIITSTELNEGKWGANFIKIGKRKSMRLAVLNIAIVVNVNPVNKKINTVRIAMGAVAPIPLRLYEVENFLLGKIYSQKVVNEAESILFTQINPRDSIRSSSEYRRDLAGVLFRRALERAVEEALKGGNSNAG